MNKALLIVNFFTLTVFAAGIRDGSRAMAEGRGVIGGYGQTVETAFTQTFNRVADVLALNPEMDADLNPDCTSCLNIERLQSLTTDGHVNVVDTGMGFMALDGKAGEAVFLDAQRWNDEYLVDPNATELIVRKLLASAGVIDPEHRLAGDLSNKIDRLNKQNAIAPIELINGI